MSPNVPENNIDVLVIGAGPAGLMAALWFSELGINARVIDKRGSKIFNGQADGIHTRTLEIFDSFGMAKNILSQSSTFVEHCTWVPTEKGGIHRVKTMPAFAADDSRFQPQTIHQGRIESIFLDGIKARSNLKVERGVEPISIELDRGAIEDPDAYPITLTLRHLKRADVTSQVIRSHWKAPKREEQTGVNGHHDGPKINQLHEKFDEHERTEIVRAKYVLGCEGAHSWTRRQLGFQMEGDTTDSIWGVMDVNLITNWPDTRKFSSIQSEHGAMLIVPRENRLNRIYIQLADNETGKSASEKLNLTSADIFSTAQKIMSPYLFDYAYCDWWTVFRVGQRVADRYEQDQRIFLAGDAVHTHTPKAGQGMNVSMQDTFNLCWKIAGVLNSEYSRAILKTYEAERRAVALQLISIDAELTQALEGRPTQDELHQLYRARRQFLSGIVTYEPNILVARSRQSSLGRCPSCGGSSAVVAEPGVAKFITLGARFSSYEVVCQADARLWQTQDWLKSDGRWRVIVFGGDVASTGQLARANKLGMDLVRVLGKFEAHKMKSKFEIFFLHSSKREQVEITDFEGPFFPLDLNFGHDYERVFADTDNASSTSGNSHGFYGVDSTRGALLLTRPDQHVGWMGEYEELRNLERYLEGVFL
ncbi:FAD binding domain protein [Talaromyces proteolyticus]|uniref:FAD binding domain protein n=1 Tax=Talaromyces proteolyticus TaxID=1131652 RepID=A0AAD4L1G8_9EURO|nr:FAD binding domain protein [Talaromyces proteolyticus]KAH8704871.1 FAD binding domain protein [Talaromyces proteolyticus]